MTCVLRAIGAGFDVDGFLADSPLRPTVVYRKGEAVAEEAAPARARATSGFNLTLGTSGFEDPAADVREALDFLDEHEEELRRLGGFEGVEQVFLDFGVPWRGVAAQTDLFPAELLWRAGALDIDLAITHYAIAAEPRRES